MLTYKPFEARKKKRSRSTKTEWRNWKKSTHVGLANSLSHGLKTLIS